MPSIFISWSSVDEKNATCLISRLKDLGLDSSGDDPELPQLWEYRDHTGLGSITAQVRDAIVQSDVAMLCLSDEAIAKPWMVSEATWSSDPRPDGRTRRVIPIRIGPTSDAKLQTLGHILPVSPADFVPNVAQGSEEELLKLGIAIFKHLKRADGKELVPKLLPIAVLAMNKTQACDLFATWLADYKAGKTAPLWDICRGLGMTNPPDLFEALKNRYDARPEDIMPFKTGESLADLIYGGLRAANLARVQMGERPIFSRWLHGELVGEDGEQRQKARNLWKSRDSLLIIDSISAFHPEVAAQLSKVPAPDDPKRAAAVYLPPYTQHTGPLDEQLRQIVLQNAAAPGLGDWFEDWHRPATDRMVSFDMATAVALSLWLNRKFREVPTDADPAIQSKRDAMRQGSPSTWTGGSVPTLGKS